MSDRVKLPWFFILYYFNCAADDVQLVAAADALEYLELVRYLTQRGSTDGPVRS